VNGSGGVSAHLSVWALAAAGRAGSRVGPRGMVLALRAGHVGKQLPDPPVDLIADRADSFQVGPARRRLIRRRLS